MYKLKATDDSGGEFQLTTGAYRLGSAWDSEIVIENDSVARYHCEVVVTAKTITVRNLSPSHETHVDGQPVQNALLRPGQTIRLGEVDLVLEEAELSGSAAPGGQLPVGQTAASQRRSRILESVGIPLLVLLVVFGVGGLVYLYRSSVERKAMPSKEKAVANPSNRKSAPSPPGRIQPQASDAAGSNLRDIDTARLTDDAGHRSRRPPGANEPEIPPDPDVQAAEAHLRTGDRARAEPLLRRALENQKAIFGPDHPRVNNTLTSLGRLLQGGRQYAKAAPYFVQALTNIQSRRGPDHPQTAMALTRLGELYLESGQYAKAAPALERAVKIQEAAPGPEPMDLGVSLNNLAMVKVAQGNYTNASPILDRALNVLEGALGKENPEFVQYYDNVGELRRAAGDYEKAEPILEQTLKRKQAEVPPDDRSIAAALNRLASVHQAQGDYASAEPLYAQAVQLAEKTFGPDHPETAKSVNNLAALHHRKGDTEKAALLYDRAAATSEKTLGPEHPQTASSLDGRAMLNACEGDGKESLERQTQALRAKLRLLEAMIGVGSEQQRLAYRDRLKPYSLAVALNSIPELAQAILGFKGIAIDSLLQDQLLAQARPDEEARVLVDLLFEMKGQLGRLLFDTPTDLSAEARAQRNAEKKGLASKLELFENDLMRLVPGFGQTRGALQVSVQQIQQAVPEGSVLVEFARYSSCVGTNQWEPSYGVMVIAPTGGLKWLSLGSADAIERNIENYLYSLQQASVRSAEAGAAPGSTIVPDARSEAEQLRRLGRSSPPGQEAGTAFADLLQALYRQLWAPIEPMLPAGTKLVIVSPDAALNLVSFATLLGADDRFLAEKVSIRYVATGRDLLRPKMPASSGSILVVGNPDFSVRSGNGSLNSSSVAANLAGIGQPDRRDLQRLDFKLRSAAADEAAQIELLFKGWNWPVVSSVGAKASEAQLAVVNSPRIVHLATWSFFLPRSAEDVEDPHGPAVEPFEAPHFTSHAAAEDGVFPDFGLLFGGMGALRNPIHRSGVALAGAQASLDAWRDGDPVPRSDDGILTVDELSTLKLRGTQLVVLSGSDRGIGSIRSGEAVLALRRAFVQAGAENLLITLRSAPESETGEFMADLYRRIHDGASAPAAFAEVQRNWLSRLRQERDLATAIRLAGSFIMNSQGALQ